MNPYKSSQTSNLKSPAHYVKSVNHFLHISGSTKVKDKENTSPPPSSDYTNTKKRREAEPRSIIRFGEQHNDIFLLRPDDRPRIALVEKLKKNPSSLSNWHELLTFRPSFEVQNYKRLRLYRRAISFLPIETNKNEPTYIDLWLQCANFKDSPDEKRKHYQEMKKLRIGENYALFYEEFAAFEYQSGNKLEAEEILVLGVRNGAFSSERKNDLLRRLSTGLTIGLSFQKLLGSTSTHKSSAPSYVIPAITKPTILRDKTFFSFKTARKTSDDVYDSSSNRVDSDLLLSPTPSAHSRISTQSTSRKKTNYSFGSLGPPLRVLATTQDSDSDLDLDDEGDEVDENDIDDAVLKELPNDHSSSMHTEHVEKPKVVESISTPSQKKMALTEASMTTKSHDLSYIRNWVPRPLEKYSINYSNGNSNVRPDTNNQKVAGQGSSKINFQSPVHRQKPPKASSIVQAQNNYGIQVANVRTPSPMSVTSTASPLTDPFSLLSSNFMVNGRTYKKLEQIGSGGSSKVYRILGEDLKIYALKRIKIKRLDNISIALYDNEIALLRRLKGNEHIIQLIDAEKNMMRKEINVIMEHGELDLNEKLRDLDNRLDENLLRVIWTQMLQAVHAIHGERIIHGDLKPANFLFVNGALKLIDFGIAKVISDDTTNIERDSQVGTVNYMSPEAIRGNKNNKRTISGKMKVSRASDIWSLGCILYQIVYGKPPFADFGSIIDKFQAIVDETHVIPFPPLNNQNLLNVMRSCLQRNHLIRPTIDGDDGLLNHPFLRSHGTSTSSNPSESLNWENAHEYISKFSTMLKDAGVSSSEIQSLILVAQKGIRLHNKNVGTFEPVVDMNIQSNSSGLFKYQDTPQRRKQI